MDLCILAPSKSMVSTLRVQDRVLYRLPSGVVRGVFAVFMVVVALRLLGEALGLF